MSKAKLRSLPFGTFFLDAPLAAVVRVALGNGWSRSVEGGDAGVGRGPDGYTGSYNPDVWVPATPVVLAL